MSRASDSPDSAGSVPTLTPDMIRQSLDLLVKRGNVWRLRCSSEAALKSGLAWWPAALPAGPLCAVVWIALQSSSPSMAAGMVLQLWIPVLLLAGPVVLVLGFVVHSLLVFRGSRPAALAPFDQLIPPGDLLRTADEFLQAPRKAGDSREAAFRRAAILACAKPLALALLTRPGRPERIAHKAPFLRWLGIPAALICIAALFPPQAKPTALNARANTASSTGLEAGETSPETHLPAARKPGTSPQAVDMPTREDHSGNGTAELPRFSNKLSEALPSRGATPAASAKELRASGDAGPLGAPRKNANAGKSPGSPSTKDTPNANPPAPQASAQPPPSTEEGQSPDVDAGRGTPTQAQGVTPQANDKPDAKDNSSAAQENDAGNDAAEENNEEQKAESTAMPMRNEPIKDVDRKLSAEPGGSYDADQRPNGRGGPGELKKSRGVPSMILGIPVPDRVPATANPGQSKITQEEGAPKPEPLRAFESEAFTPAPSPTGAQNRSKSTPWSRQILINYFKTPTRSAADKAAGQTP